VEAKAIGLTHSVAQNLGLDYVVVRKNVKSYMEDPLVKKVDSITTGETQTLVLDSRDVEKINGKDIAIVEDVVSTGSTMRSLEKILEETDANIKVKAAILEEGQHHEDVYTIGELPVFRDMK
jgi:adenine phosphoribosyltransferase